MPAAAVQGAKDAAGVTVQPLVRRTMCFRSWLKLIPIFRSDPLHAAGWRRKDEIRLHPVLSFFRKTSHATMRYKDAAQQASLEHRLVCFACL